MSEPKLHNIMFAIVNDEWQATWIEGKVIVCRNLHWYEWPYLWMIQMRDAISSRRKTS